MKYSIHLVVASLVLWGCNSSTSTKKSSSSNSNQSTTCYYDYYTNPNCPGYGQTSGGSSTTSSGTNSGSSTTGTGSGGTSNYQPISATVNHWAARYNASGKPDASTTVTGCGSYSNDNLPNPRKGTVHMAFRQDYNPDIPAIQNSLYWSKSISSFLTSVDEAKAFIDTDSLLRVRVIPKPQRVPSDNDQWCYGRKLQSGSGMAYGYTELEYSLSVRGIRPDGSLTGYLGTKYLTTAIQTCSPVQDFSGYASLYPNGVVLAIHDVRSNQGCWKYPCSNNWSAAETTCWGMDIEVAVDGTKTF